LGFGRRPHTPQPPTPNPQSPIPNPHPLKLFYNLILRKKKYIKNEKY